jgi:hypothetical protein
MPTPGHITTIDIQYKILISTAIMLPLVSCLLGSRDESKGKLNLREAPWTPVHLSPCPPAGRTLYYSCCTPPGISRCPLDGMVRTAHSRSLPLSPSHLSGTAIYIPPLPWDWLLAPGREGGVALVVHR